jgi:hypothetical protein
MHQWRPVDSARRVLVLDFGFGDVGEGSNIRALLRGRGTVRELFSCGCA